MSRGAVRFFEPGRSRRGRRRQRWRRTAAGCARRPNCRRSPRGSARCTGPRCETWTMPPPIPGWARTRPSAVNPDESARYSRPIVCPSCWPPIPAMRWARRMPAGAGLAAGVIEAAVRSLGRAPTTLLAWLGPAIGPRHFEIGGEVREALLHADPGAEAAFQPNARGRFMADLPALARRRLERLGIERIYGGGACTFQDPDRYFSHRRDGRTGRQATLIWLET